MLKFTEVLKYLMEWQNGQTNLRVILSAHDGTFRFNCTLLSFSEMGVSFQLSGDFDQTDLVLAAYHFELLNESEANMPHELIKAHPIYARGLKGTRSPDEILLILEI
jgi:hypothetical protein